MLRIAVIGAGLSGLVVAHRLAARHAVTVFEKSRGVGGRMATRRVGEFRFDHGAQFLTARTTDFRRFLAPFIDAGAVASWHARFAELRNTELSATRQWGDSVPHYVGVPGMNALAKALARDIDVQLQTPVTAIEKEGGQWSIHGENGQVVGEFDWTIIAIPATQAASLAAMNPALASRAAGADMVGCYALMLGFEGPLALPWQAARVRDCDISWLSVNSSKPGRSAAFSLVAHSTNAWAENHIESDAEDVRDHLLAEVERVTGIDCGAAKHVGLHRWRYANIDRQDGAPCFFDAGERLAACGDWFIRGRVEAAFSSAEALLERLANRRLAP